MWTQPRATSSAASADSSGLGSTTFGSGAAAAAGACTGAFPNYSGIYTFITSN